MPKRSRGEEESIKRRKTYAHIRDPHTGRRVLAHRWVAEQALGRPLLPREVVHHKDGDSLNNDPSNLIVLPSQRVHAHAEFHLRRLKAGMPALFPEIFQIIPSGTNGTLFAHILIWQGQEPPLKKRQAAKPSEEIEAPTPPTLFASAASDTKEFAVLVNLPKTRGAMSLKELLSHIQLSEKAISTRKS